MDEPPWSWSPEPALEATASSDSMGSIVLTTDLSEESRRAFAPTANMASALGKNIVLLHVVPESVALPHGSPLAPPIWLSGTDAPSQTGAPSDTGVEVRSAQDQLDELAGSLGGRVRTEVIVAANVSEAIVDFAERVDADFIALSTHGRTGVRRLLMGSVAEGVMRCSNTPLVFFPRKEE